MSETSRSPAFPAYDKDSLLGLLANQMETLLWTTDLDGRVTSFIGGMPGEPPFDCDPVGQGVGELFGASETQDIPLEAHDRALRGETVAFDIEHDGGCYEAYVEPLRDGQGAITGCVGVALRVSALDREASTRRELHRRPAWGAAYDFNVLVSLIQGYSRLILRQLHHEDPLRGALQGIVRASDRAAAILQGDNGCVSGGSPRMER
jgi:hypothetical protein